MQEGGFDNRRVKCFKKKDGPNCAGCRHAKEHDHSLGCGIGDGCLPVEKKLKITIKEQPIIKLKLEVVDHCNSDMIRDAELSKNTAGHIQLVIWLNEDANVMGNGTIIMDDDKKEMNRSFWIVSENQGELVEIQVFGLPKDFVMLSKKIKSDETTKIQMYFLSIDDDLEWDVVDTYRS